MKKILLYLITTTILTSSYAQQNNEVREPSRFITKFHFKQLTGGVVLLEAFFDTLKVPFNFILDTGSGAISLDSITVENYNIANITSGKTIRGIAGIREVNFAKNHSLTFPGLVVDSLDFYINNYDILTSVYGIKIDGIIGYSLISRYIIKIDFDSLEIEMFTPGKIKYPNGGTTFTPTFTGLPIQNLTIEDARKLKTRVYIDTGAGLCLLVTEKLASDSSYFKKKRKPLPILAQGLGGKKPIMITVSKKVKLGPYTFRKVPTHILDDTYNVISYPFLGGLIGNDLLRRFNMIINYPAKEIHLKPNSHFKSPFDYSYSGLNLYEVDGTIEIHDIAPKSPAEKAGLIDGDILVAVNKNFSNNIQKYKDLLNITKTTVPLIILRNQELITIKLKVSRIY
ncbi:MAG: aspartyl protease family protein [Ginsengibacter sp.]